MSSFYQFALSDYSTTVYLNKAYISSINQKGIGFGTEIKMSNGDVFKVNNDASQVISILENQGKG